MIFMLDIPELPPVPRNAANEPGYEDLFACSDLDIFGVDASS